MKEYLWKVSEREGKFFIHNKKEDFIAAIQGDNAVAAEQIVLDHNHSIKNAMKAERKSLGKKIKGFIKIAAR